MDGFEVAELVLSRLSSLSRWSDGFGDGVHGIALESIGDAQGLIVLQRGGVFADRFDATQVSFPVVRVPVLSKAMRLQLASASRMMPPLRRIPLRAQQLMALK